MRPALDGCIERTARNPEEIKYRIHKIGGKGEVYPKVREKAGG